RPQDGRWLQALHDAGHRLALALPAPAGRHGAAVAVAAAGRVHDVRPARPYVCVADAQAVRSAGRQVLDNGIGVFHQPPEHVLRFGRLKIDEERALAPVEVPADPCLRWVNLDDLGAELVEQAAAGGPGEGNAV